jgi:flagellar biosynthesis protein FlhF
MKIKSYRAATLREALIRIKKELGEDALVIETKRVRAGGIFGVGARDQIEVRVALNSKDEAPKRRKPQGQAVPKNGARLSLKDDSAAAPAAARSAARPKSGNRPTNRPAAASGTLAALMARAYTAGGNAPLQSKTAPAQLPALAGGQGVELADTAPRIVHRRSAPRPAGEGANGQGAGAKDQHNSVNIELARLRAELREMKFAMSATAPAARRDAGALAAFESEPEFRDSPSYEIYLELASAGLPQELACQAAKDAARGETAGGSRRPRDANAAAREALAAALPDWVRFADMPLTSNGVAAFIGPTGVGKTTTIAKLAARIALRAKQRVELVTLDNYRIAAVQQLKTYAEIIGAGCHIANSVVELDALLRRFAGKATVLVDTTGRSPHDLADQMELADHLRRNDSLLKCLVLPATTQLSDAQLALNKFSLYGANRLVLTKLDETMQPGAAVSAAAFASLPLIYLCAGQRVPEDLERASPASFAARVMRPRMAAAAG